MIKSNKSIYYGGCSYKEMDDCTVSKTEDCIFEGLYYNTTHCGKEELFPEKLFDIPRNGLIEFSSNLDVSIGDTECKASG